MGRTLRHAVGTGLVALLAACGGASADGWPLRDLETRSFVNAGLKDLLRIDLHVEPESGRVVGTFSVVEDYGEGEEARRAFGFTGRLVGHDVQVSFADGRAPYPLPPDREDDAPLVWRLVQTPDGRAHLDIDTYGRDHESGEWSAYVMRAAELE